MAGPSLPKFVDDGYPIPTETANNTSGIEWLYKINKSAGCFRFLP